MKPLINYLKSIFKKPKEYRVVIDDSGASTNRGCRAMVIEPFESKISKDKDFVLRRHYILTALSLNGWNYENNMWTHPDGKRYSTEEAFSQLLFSKGITFKNVKGDWLEVSGYCGCCGKPSYNGNHDKECMWYEKN